jgi:hypothetical protein
VAELLRVNPDYSIEQRRKVLPYKNPEDFERVVEGLRKAGLPEERSVEREQPTGWTRTYPTVICCCACRGRAR